MSEIIIDVDEKVRLMKEGRRKHPRRDQADVEARFCRRHAVEAAYPMLLTSDDSLEERGHDDLAAVVRECRGGQVRGNHQRRVMTLDRDGLIALRAEIDKGSPPATSPGGGTAALADRPKEQRL